MPDLEISPAGGGSGTNTDPNHFTENADGFTITGGTTERDLKVNGADVEIQGSGTATVTFPASTSTLATTSLAETLTNKTLSSGTKINPGSTAAGDMWESTDSNGTVGTIPIGPAGYFLAVNGTGTGHEYKAGSTPQFSEHFSSGPDSVTATRYIGYANADTTIDHVQRIAPAGTVTAMYASREVNSSTASVRIYKNGSFVTGATCTMSSTTTANVTGLSISFNGTTDYIAVEVTEDSGAISGNYQCRIYYTPGTP